MGKTKMPGVPDFTDIEGKLNANSARLLKLAESQFKFAQSTWAHDSASRDQILGTVIPEMQRQSANAQADRNRLTNVYQPLEDRMINEAKGYDTQARREQEAARAQNDVATQVNAAEQNASSQLADLGVDPSMLRAGAMRREAAVQKGALMAQAGNDARQQVEDKGRELVANAAGMGEGYRTSALQGGQLAGSLGQTAAGVNQTTTATGLQGAQLGQSAIGQSAGIQQDWANTLSGLYGTQVQGAASRGSSGAGIGQLLGTLGSAAIMGMMTGVPVPVASEGGMIPRNLGSGKRDDVPSMLTAGEYVIPAEVVRAKGTEFFDKLINKKGGSNSALMGAR